MTGAAEHRRLVLLYPADLKAGRLPVTVADVRREPVGRDLVCWYGGPDEANGPGLPRV